MRYANIVKGNRTSITFMFMQHFQNYYYHFYHLDQ